MIKALNIIVVIKRCARDSYTQPEIILHHTSDEPRQKSEEVWAISLDDGS